LTLFTSWRGSRGRVLAATAAAPLNPPPPPPRTPADCFKWGYNGTFSVVGLKVSVAADALGIDLAADLGLSLAATDIIGKTTTLEGSFLQVRWRWRVYVCVLVLVQACSLQRSLRRVRVWGVGGGGGGACSPRRPSA
jgi:hypothetical protein